MRALGHLSLALRSSASARASTALLIGSLLGDARAVRRWHDDPAGDDPLGFVLDTVLAGAWAATSGPDEAAPRGILLAAAVPEAFAGGLLAVEGRAASGGSASGDPGQTLRDTALVVGRAVAPAVAISVVRRVRGWSPGFGHVAWPILGVVAGAVVAVQQRRQHARVEELWRLRTGHEVAEEYRMARSEAASRSDLAHNELPKVLSAIGMLGEPPYRPAIDAAKRERAHPGDRTSAVLGGTQLGRLTRLPIEPPDAGRFWVHAGAVDAVRSFLCRIDRGDLPSAQERKSGATRPAVPLDDDVATAQESDRSDEPDDRTVRATRRADGSLVIEHRGQRLVERRPIPDAIARLDPLAPGQAMSAVWKISTSLPPLGNLPWWATVPSAAVDCIFAVRYWADPPEQPGTALWAPALSTVLLDLVIATGRGATATETGSPVYPASAAVYGPLLVAARYSSVLTPADRVVVAGLLVTWLIASVVPGHRSGRDVFAELAVVLMTALAPLGLHRRIARDADELEAQLEAAFGAALTEVRRRAFEDERRHDEHLYALAIEAMAVVGPQLDDRTRQELHDDLAEIATTLEDRDGTPD